jgi:ABC-type uncharacterized transport system fused permease/ATPase subunit
MKKLLSESDYFNLTNDVIDLLVSKKCTFADFEKVSEKVHQFYKSNAVVEATTAIRKNTGTRTHHHQQSDTNDQGL